MSGYLVKIEVFIPADPRKPGTMEDAIRFIDALMRGHGILEDGQVLKTGDFDAEWKAAPARWLANRKNSAPQPSGAPAGQDGAGEAKGPQSQASPRSDGAFGDLERQMRGA